MILHNTFKNYLASTAKTTKKNKILTKTFYRLSFKQKQQYKQPTDREEIAKSISFLNSAKASGANSIPYTMLFLSKKLHFEAFGRFIQTLFHEGCFSICTQNCRSSSWF